MGSETKANLTSEKRDCNNCRHTAKSELQHPCLTCHWSPISGNHTNWEPRPDHNGGPPLTDTKPWGGLVENLPSHLPEDDKARTEYPVTEGCIDYFPNAIAEVARLSFLATQQHHPDQPMHWDRSKSTEHADKIVRHLIDRGKRDKRGIRHSAMVAWRALALLQEEIERDEGAPPSRASRNRPY